MGIRNGIAPNSAIIRRRGGMLHVSVTKDTDLKQDREQTSDFDVPALLRMTGCP